MVSNIVTTYPIAGIDQSSDGFRENFSAAKLEIEALQAADISIIGDVSTNQVDIATLFASTINIIDDISDVDTTTVPPINGDFLQFVSPNWVPASPSIPVFIGNLLDVDTSTNTPLFNQVLTYDGADWVPQDNENGVAIEDDGGAVGVFQTIDFVGDAVTAVLTPGSPPIATVTIEPNIAVKNFAEPGDFFVINTKRQLIVYQEYVVEAGGTLTIEANAALVVL